MFDYLKWRGDITFSQVPVNPVDALIFSSLSYIYLEDILPDNPHQWMALSDVVREVFSLPDAVGRGRVKNDLELLKAAAETVRFGRTGMTFCKDVLVPEEETQFAAVTFYLDDGCVFIAFRGTDHSLTGWKEDFNMAFQESVPAQRMAMQYLKDFSLMSSVPMYVGGHSKGGNLAVYAAAKCGEMIQHQIRAVYNHDGPGFTEHMMEDEGYLRIIPKIHTFIPQSSVVGMLLEHEEPYTVVKSKQIGLLQHDPYTWEVLGGNFITMEEITADSKFIDRTLKVWLADLDKDERNDFVDAVFDLLAAGDASETKEIMRPKNVVTYLQTLSTDEDMRKRLSGRIAGLIQAVKKK